MKTAAALFQRLSTGEKIKFCRAQGDGVTALYHDHKHEIAAKSEADGIELIKEVVQRCNAEFDGYVYQYKPDAKPVPVTHR